MKQYLITLIAIISICFCTAAQRVEVFGGYSYGSEIGKLVNSKPSLPDEIGSMNVGDQGNKGAFTIGVNARVFKGLSAGISWTSINNTERRFSYPHHSSFPNNFKQGSSSILFSFKYDWFKFLKLNLYSRAGIGAVFYNTPKFHSENYQFDNFIWSNGAPKACTRLAWQVSFVGIEYRPIKWVGVFAEGGLGRQGALLAGLKVFI
ncbi:MAG: hypothetical protein K2K27_07320 [Muribaculaceae bacterium]|nr:hypothetical protein [Muribaculaceae bacterium]MDE6643893.1 hypothetical protein [Muribaculaceae bacterium]